MNSDSPTPTSAAARSPRLDPGAALALTVAESWPAIAPEELSPERLRLDMERQRVLAGDPEPVASVRDLVVPRAEGGELGLRVYAPASRPVAAVLFIHGGGWMMGSPGSHDGLCRAITNRAGAVVASVDYRLAPEHPFPAGLEDCLLAACWLREGSGELGAPEGGIVVAGDSSGANLAAALCLRLRELGLPRPLGQVLAYPALDPSRDSGSHREVGEDYFVTSESIGWFWGQYVADPADLRRPLVAPLLGSSLAGLPPTLILTAEFDPLRDEGERYAERLAADGVPVRCSRYDGQIHGFLVWDRHIPRAAAAKAEIGAWIRALSR